MTEKNYGINFSLVILAHAYRIPVINTWRRYDMARKLHPSRSLRELYSLARDIGAENVLLYDQELGAVLAGSDKAPLAVGTIANMRMMGRLNMPVVRIGRTPKTRMADALAYLDHRTEKAAA